MDQQQMFMMLPGLQPDELLLIQNLTKSLSEVQQQQFFAFYQGKRKEQQNLTILAIIGFFGVAGIHRFVIGEVGMGILYFLTGGFCGIGTIIDLVNMKQMTSQYNQRQAIETAKMVNMITPQ
jgi:TM2 domain-containing membrane protein YozV